MVTANNKNTMFDYFTMNKKIIPKPFRFIKEKCIKTSPVLKSSKKPFFHYYSFIPYNKHANGLELEDGFCRHWLTQQNDEVIFFLFLFFMIGIFHIYIYIY